MVNFQLKHLLMLSFTLLCTYSIAQQSSYKELLAIKLEKNIAMEFQKAPDYGVFTVNKNGIFKAEKGYHIILMKKGKNPLQLKPVKKDIPVLTKGNYEEIELPGGALLICLCVGSSGPDDCYFVPNEDYSAFTCGGTCGCDSGVIFNGDDISQIQHTDGSWHNY